VKVSLAVAILDRVHRGELDGAAQIVVRPGRVTSRGPIGVTRFRHPARIAIDDLLYLSVCLSDTAAPDALFDLIPPADVAAVLRAAGLRGITVRHTMSTLNETPADRLSHDEVDLAHTLAIEGGTPGRGHRIAHLDVTRTNSGTARSFVDLLQALWARPASTPRSRRGCAS
jgi:beta-lactamase class A